MSLFSILAHRSDTRENNTRLPWSKRHAVPLYLSQVEANNIAEAIANFNEPDYTIVAIEEQRPPITVTDEMLNEVLLGEDQFDNPDNYANFTFEDKFSSDIDPIIKAIIRALDNADIVPGLEISIVSDEYNYYANLEVYRHGPAVYNSIFFDMRQIIYNTETGWDAILEAARIIIRHTQAMA